MYMILRCSSISCSTQEVDSIALTIDRLWSSWPSGPSHPPTWPSWGWTQVSLILPSLVTRANGMPTLWSPLGSECGRMAALWAAPWGPVLKWTTLLQVCHCLQVFMRNFVLFMKCENHELLSKAGKFFSGILKGIHVHILWEDRLFDSNCTNELFSLVPLLEPK